MEVDDVCPGSPSFDGLADVLDDPVIVWSSHRDADGQIIDFVYEFVNRAAVETIGIPADELLGNRLLDILPVHVELGLFDRYCAVAETGVPDIIEIPWFEDGNVAGAFEARISQVAGGIMSVARNITDRVLAEQRLRTGGRRMRLLLEHGTDTMFHVVDGVIEWVTPSVADLLGADPAGVIGTRAAAWCPPGAFHLLDRPSTTTEADNARAGRLRRGDGGWQDVLVRVDRIGDGSGEVVAIVRPAPLGPARTVDDALARLPHTTTPQGPADRTVRAVFDLLPEPVMVVNRRLFEYGNRAAGELCGLESGDDLIGRDFGDFLTPEAITEALEFGRRFRDGETSAPFATWMNQLDGTPKRIEITLAPAPGDGDSLLLVLRDVTERDRLSEELARSEATGRFLTENSTDALLRVGSDRRIMFASAATLSIAGHAPADLVGTSLERLFDADDRANVEQQLRMARLTGTAKPLEVRIPRDGPGEEMWVEVEARCVHLDDRPIVDDGNHEFHVTLYDVRSARRNRERLATSEQRLRTLVDGAPIGIFELDAAGGCTFVNARYCQIMGIAGLNEVKGRKWLQLLHPEDRAAATARWSDPSTAREAFELDVRFVRPDGSLVETVVGIAPVIDSSDHVAGWLGSVDDITERLRLQQSRKEALDLFATAFDNGPMAQTLMSVDEFPPRLIRANTEMLRLTGMTEHELADTDFYEVTHPDDVATATAGRAALLAGEIDTHEMEIRQRFAADHSYRWFHLVRSVVRDDDGRAMHLVAQTSDITERKETEQLVYDMAVTDPLTGLSNRRHFQDRLANTHARLFRSDARIGVIFIDLDHFKVVNDELGHRAGDEVLQRIARIIASEIRPGDTAARLGGDEFTILAEHLDETVLIGLAERLRDAIDLHRTLPGGRAHRITASIGLVSRRSSEVEPDDLVQLADQAMYLAKREGRHRCRVADHV